MPGSPPLNEHILHTLHYRHALKSETSVRSRDVVHHTIGRHVYETCRHSTYCAAQSALLYGNSATILRRFEQITFVGENSWTVSRLH